MFCILIHKCLSCPVNLPVNTHVLHGLCWYSTLLCQCYPLSHRWEIILLKWSPFFPHSISTQISWLCFNVLQVHLMQHLWSLNRHFLLSTDTPPTRNACTSGHLFACHFSHFWCGCSYYMCTSKSAYFPPVLLTDKKEGLLRFQANKLFWFDNHHRFQSRAGISEKSKVMEMEYYSSNNLAVT